MPMIRVPDITTAAAARGLDLPAFAGAAKLSPTEVDRLASGAAIRVKASTETRVAKLLGLRQKDIHAANDAGEGEGDGDAPVDYADDAPPAWDDREPVMGDAPAPRSSARGAPDEGPTVPPMEAALRAALASGAWEALGCEDPEQIARALHAVVLAMVIEARLRRDVDRVDLVLRGRDGWVACWAAVDGDGLTVGVEGED